MKQLLVGLCFLFLGQFTAYAQAVKGNPGPVEQEIIDLSRQKWQWMEEKNVDRLAPLFHARAKFVHMSGTWGTAEELDIIKTGRIWYKKADVHQTVVQVFGETAVLWNRITLQAVVRGNEVSNPFTVTEVYQKEKGAWHLLALTFSSVRPEHNIEDK
jgi:hypothetical protein